MRIHLLGVRGSTPAPGPEFTGVGGHTSCVAVSAGTDGAAPPTVVLDAGTGLQRLGQLLGGAPFRGSVLLTHLHWDHTHGLPFWPAGDRADARVDVLLPAPDDGTGECARDVMARAMSPPHFPIGPDGLLGAWRWHGIGPGHHRVEGLDVDAFEVPHKGGRTFGYRIAEPGAGSVAYVPDHLPRADGPDPTLVARLQGSDVLLHDAQFTSAEAEVAQRYGHSTVDQAIELARAAGVQRLVLFHHGPTRTDEEVERIERDAAALAGADLDVVAARGGMVIETAPATVGSWPTSLPTRTSPTAR
ncbi:MBL fold metallo-hydrolase [Dermatobacter hominis]|uniref:MBL fold metallo-hydrolase n=1 Tax=Dermatobacter hominis TaxID=2884263 RepID=UPI001D0FF956|nr:MBL fold metallo-hydrolase [Dermatobacter hominis]UDY35672.1 MBL fold metallo-hydrolase [Dermatobacter hominis]